MARCMVLPMPQMKEFKNNRVNQVKAQSGVCRAPMYFTSTHSKWDDACAVKTLSQQGIAGQLI